MKLIVDIPKKEYQYIINEGFLERTHGKMCYKAIKKAIPLKQIKGEIQNAYNDNKECDQEDVAYGLKIAMDIIEECR